MSDRRWLHVAALGGFVVGALILASAERLALAQAPAEGNPAAVQPTPAQQNNNAEQPPSAVPENAERVAQTEEAERAKQEATNREIEDLKAQRRMADAAEKQLDLIWWQNLITSGEAGLLLLTLAATAWAAYAAAAAAKAAEKSADLAHKTERPYLIFKVRMEFLESGNTGPTPIVTGYCTIHNHGKTPAIITGLSIELEFPPVHVEYLDNPIRYLPSLDYEVGRVIEAGNFYNAGPLSFSLPQSDARIDTINLIQNAKLWPRFFGMVSYKDVFDHAYETRFLCIYNGQAKRSHLSDRAGHPEDNSRT